VEKTRKSIIRGFLAAGLPTFAPFDFERYAKLPDGTQVTIAAPPSSVMNSRRLMSDMGLLPKPVIVNFDRADLKGVTSEKDDLFYIPQFEGIREGYVGGYHQGAMGLRAGSSGAYCLERCSGRQH
jgi:hypothetical protein